MPVKKSPRPKSRGKRSPSGGRKRLRSSSKSKEPSKKAAVSRTKFTFPVQTIHEFMQQKFPAGEVKSEAAVFLCGLMEYLAVELLELSINVCQSQLKKPGSTAILKASDVETAIQNDEELRELMDNVNKVIGNKGA